MTRMEKNMPIHVIEKKDSNVIEKQMVSNTIIPAEAAGFLKLDKKIEPNECAKKLLDRERFSAKSKKSSFEVISDTQIGIAKDLDKDPKSLQYSEHFNLALKDIKALDPESDGIFIVGDNTNNGKPEEYDEMLRIISENRDGLPNLYYAIGNHDFYTYGGNWQASIDLFKEKTGMENHYYEKIIKDMRFIVLGSDTPTHNASLSDQQFQWLEERLREETSFRQPVFVFLHQSLYNTVSGSLPGQGWHGIDQDKRLRDVFRRYPQTVFFTGHSHWELDSQSPMYPGNGVMATCFNTASCGYLWTDAQELKIGSQGYYVEVYEDAVLVRGRDYLNGKWVSGAQFVINLDENFKLQVAALLQEDLNEAGNLVTYQERIEKSIADIKNRPEKEQYMQLLQQLEEQLLKVKESISKFEDFTGGHLSVCR